MQRPAALAHHKRAADLKAPNRRDESPVLVDISKSRRAEFIAFVFKKPTQRDARSH